MWFSINLILMNIHGVVAPCERGCTLLGEKVLHSRSDNSGHGVRLAHSPLSAL